MTLAIIDSLITYRFPAIRQLRALKRSLAALQASEIQAPELEAALERAIAQARELWLVEKRRRRKAHRNEHGDKARELDQALDAQLTGLEGSLRFRARLTDALPESAAEAQRCLDTLFPNGIGVLVNANYNEQAEETEILLRQLREDSGFVTLMEELGLGPVVDKTEALLREYSAEVSGGSRLSPEELAALRRQSDEALGEVIARIYGLFPTENEDDRRHRGELMAPIWWQNESLRLLYKERRRGRPSDDDLDAIIDDPAIEDEPGESEGLTSAA